MMIQIVDPPKPLSHTNGPGEGRTFNLKFILDIIKNINRSHPFTVKFIYKSLLSKIDIFFGQHFHESPLWQKYILTSPFEKGDERGIFKTVREIPPTPL